MNTSYYAKYKGENAVSIAGKCPDWFKGREYKKLAPKYWFFKEYKDTIASVNKPSGQSINQEIRIKNIIQKAEELYIKNYQKEVLDKLNPQQVYEELGEDAVLLCWEKTGQFCHRHLVAKWLEKELGVKITEL